MSTAVSRNAIGYNEGGDFIWDKMFENQTYKDAFVTKDWNLFLSKLNELGD